jgi:hypothetical protein
MRYSYLLLEMSVFNSESVENNKSFGMKKINDELNEKLRK